MKVIDIAPMVTSDCRPNIDRNLFTARADALDATIRKLSAMRDGLRHAAACKAPSHLECPTFRRLLSAASDNAAKKRSKPRAVARP